MNDRRIRKTKEALRNSLIELIGKKSFQLITVNDITTKADINRGTFYLHYSDKYDLLESIENSLVEVILEYMKKAILDTNSISKLFSEGCANPLFLEIARCFYDNYDFFSIMLSQNGRYNIFLKLKKQLAELIINVNVKKTDIIPTEYFGDYILSGVFSIIENWIRNGMNESPEEIVLIIVKTRTLSPLQLMGQS